MKKFIAGVVMTGLIFMAMATGAMANSKWSGRNTWQNGTANGAKNTSCNSGSTSAEAGDYTGYC